MPNPNIAGTMKTSEEKAAADKTATRKPPRVERPDGWRETVESIVVAFVLAFLFRTFEAEAFVIPTGSMAPTLFGQHRDIHCAKCGTRFAVGVSSGTAQDAEVRNGFIVPSDRTEFAVCPNANCRYPNNVLDDEMFAGDRILVDKFPYEFADPDRYDVVVFKYPEGAKTNYIKRLVGLPGEEVKIENGDVLVRPLGSQVAFKAARKRADKQRNLQLPVYDDDHPARELLEAGWPEAFAPEGGVGWSVDPKERAYRADPDPADPMREQWLRYANYVPSSSDWMNAESGQRISVRPQPQEVRDYYAYNARITARDADLAVSQGKLPDLLSRDNPTKWVGDLTVHATVEVLVPDGELTLELVEGARRYRCRIDLKTGRGQLQYQPEQGPDDEKFQPAGDDFDTGMNSKDEFELSFANVDDRLCLWIDGRLLKELEFNEGSKYPPPQQPVLVTDRDKTPVGIGARGASLRVSHFRIERDIYYILEGGAPHLNANGAYELRDADDDAEDQFLMLGDNSPRSNDGRAWLTTHAVPRRLLIGKAFFIYWPHGVPFLNDGRGFPIPLGSYHERNSDGRNAQIPLPKMSLPFYPQVGRMHRIR